MAHSRIISPQRESFKLEAKKQSIFNNENLKKIDIKYKDW